LADPLQASLLKLSAAGTSVFCPHSSLDATWGGINDWLADGVMGPQKATAKIDILGEPKGEAGGAGRIVTLDEPIPIEELVQRVKKHLSLSQGRLHISLLRAYHESLITMNVQLT
jgi:putative NIF3 family GTP cyclohydrolase 1 type 2